MKRLVQEQFGAHAQDFVTSKAHSQGRSLARLIELVNPQPGWRILDVATGGGHNALAFARHASEIIAIDLTHPMLTAARSLVRGEGAKNIRFCMGDAEQLPFAADSFRCVTCRIAPHHFSDITRFVAEASRVTAPGGILAIADNVVSDEADTAGYVNALERLRDPSHHWAYSLEDWETFFSAAGLTVTFREAFEKETDFDEWASRMGVRGERLIRLRVMILQAPEGALQWLKPRLVGGRLLFSTREAVVIGQKRQP